MACIPGKINSGTSDDLTFYSFFIFGPLQEIGNIIMSYREAEASLINFDSVMKKAPEVQPVHPASLGIVKELRFQHVSFKHLTAQYKALDNINFSVEQGETIAFVGPSGSGKSTLVKLLVGLYHPLTGKVFYNEIDSNDIRLKN